MKMKIRGCLLITALVLTSPSAQAQRSDKVPRIGVLLPGADRGEQTPSRAAFEPALKKLGWIAGETIIIERRFAAGKLDSLPKLATELATLPVDIFLASSEAIHAAKNVTQSLPIIMSFSIDDPVEARFVSSLAHPGGNVTGITLQAPELGGKRLELLKEAVSSPRVAVLSFSESFQPGESAKRCGAGTRCSFEDCHREGE